MSDQGSAKYLKKLVGIDNYEVWKFPVESLLQHDDIWDLISREEETVAVLGRDGVLELQLVPRQYTALETQRRRQKALSIIRVSISNEVIPTSGTRPIPPLHGQHLPDSLEALAIVGVCS